MTFSQFVRLKKDYDLSVYKLQYMGLFNKLFNSSSSSENTNELPWITLSTMSQLDEIKEISKTKTQLIFKHSTRCGISRIVKKQFENDYNFSENTFDLYYLDLISYRDVSNQIAQQFQVIHESPQLLVIKNGVVVAHHSHSDINTVDLAAFA